MSAESADVAIKIPHRALQSGITDADFGATITAYEALIGRRLAHPNALRVFDFHSDGQNGFVTMEYLAGETLAARLQRTPGGRLPPRLALPVIDAIARGLAAMHAAGVAHSDVKPSNVLIGDNGSVKLIDFASARPLSGAGRGASADSGYIGYSPRYASPELLQDQPASAADDVYSLACLSYELLSGERPFGEHTALEAQRLGLRPRRPRQIGPLRWLALRRGLALSRTRRYQRVGSLQRALRLAGLAPGAAAAALAACLTLATAGALLPAAGERDGADSALLRTHALIEQVRAADIWKRPEIASQADQLAAPLDAAILASVQHELIADLHRAIRALPEIEADAAQLAQASSALRTAQRLYPDSARLLEAHSLLAARQELALAQAREAWRSLWARARLQPEEAPTLAAQAMALIELHPGENLNEDAHVERFRAALRATRDGYDFWRLAELTAFAEALPMLPALKDAAYATVADAGDLEAYIRSYRRRGARAPAALADRFWRGYLARLEATAPNLWWEGELAAAQAQLTTLRQALPPDYPPLARASRSLAQALLRKARAHERLDEIQKSEALRKDAKWLIDNWQLPGETPRDLASTERAR